MIMKKIVWKDEIKYFLIAMVLIYIIEFLISKEPVHTLQLLGSIFWKVLILSIVRILFNLNKNNSHS